MKKLLVKMMFLLGIGMIFVPAKAFCWSQQLTICDNWIDCGEVAITLCGNGTKNAGEECDGDPTVCPVSGSTCSSTCDCVPPPPPLPVCGDGNVDAGEECDGSNVSACPVSGSTCSSTCACVPPQPQQPDPQPTPTPTIDAQAPVLHPGSASGNGIQPILEGRGCSFNPLAAPAGFTGELLIFALGLFPIIGRRFKKVK